jgi:hypothetical protein
MVYASSSSSTALQTFERENSPVATDSPLKPVAKFVGSLMLMWLLLFATSVMLPFIKPGSDIIAAAKFKNMVTERMFGPQDRYRVMLFGHSKLLASARPRELDATMGPGFRSYNLGLPGEPRFLPILESALRAGNIPTHVLLTLPWDAKEEPGGVLDALRDDSAIASLVMPFRTLPRDAALFAFQNRNHLAEAVREVDVQRQGMLEQRGWYFIKSQSRYENDRLPDDYTLPTDRPTRIEVRQLPDKSFVRQRLERLAQQYGFQILLIPVTSRIGEYARAPISDQARFATISTEPLIRIVGPDYLSYPPAYFADPQHMNPDGARVYTADLARLLKRSGVFD